MREFFGNNRVNPRQIGCCLARRPVLPDHLAASLVVCYSFLPTTSRNVSLISTSMHLAAGGNVHKKSPTSVSGAAKNNVMATRRRSPAPLIFKRSSVSSRMSRSMRPQPTQRATHKARVMMIPICRGASSRKFQLVSVHIILHFNILVNYSLVRTRCGGIYKRLPYSKGVWKIRVNPRQIGSALLGGRCYPAT